MLKCQLESLLEARQPSDAGSRLAEILCIYEKDHRERTRVRAALGELQDGSLPKLGDIIQNAS